MRRQQQQDQQSRIFYELSALVLYLLRSPPTPIPISDRAPAEIPPDSVSQSSSSRRSSPAAMQISPAGLVSLLLGISLALMLCGSVTFFIGFMLMPWVLVVVMVFYVAAVVSTISMLGRSLICYAVASTSSWKKIPEHQFSDGVCSTLAKKRGDNNRGEQPAQDYRETNKETQSTVAGGIGQAGMPWSHYLCKMDNFRMETQGTLK